MDKANADVLDWLFAVIVNRRQGDPDTFVCCRFGYPGRRVGPSSFSEKLVGFPSNANSSLK